VRTWKEQIGNMKKLKNSTPAPALPRRQNHVSFKCMLYCLIAWAKFQFLHLFVSMFKQLGGLLMNQLIKHGGFMGLFCFYFFFFRWSHVVLPFGPFPFKIYIHESWNIAKQYGVKIEVFLGILKEQFENLMRIDKKKWIPPSWSPKPKREKIKHL